MCVTQSNSSCLPELARRVPCELVRVLSVLSRCNGDTCSTLPPVSLCLIILRLTSDFVCNKIISEMSNLLFDTL